MHNESSVYDIAGFASYDKDRISFSIFANNNIGNFEENGGIEDAKYIRDTTISPENIPVKLLFPETHFYNINIKTSAQYNIGKSKDIFLANDTIKYYPFKVTYTFSARRQSTYIYRIEYNKWLLQKQLSIKRHDLR